MRLISAAKGLRVAACAGLCLVLSASVADARGGGGGGMFGGGGGMFGGGGGMSGGGGGGGFGGGSPGGGRGGNATDPDELAKQQDRKDMILERRRRAADNDRADRQEARLAALRLAAAARRCSGS
jgi:hypothetical protein